MKLGLLCGIYKLENEKGEVLVGSSEDIARRWSWYMATLKGNKFKRYPQLQDSYNENVHNIKFEILEECDAEELAERELYYFRYIERVEGWKLINIQKTKANRHKVKDVSKMKAAQSGSGNGNCKLSIDEVREIMWLKENGYKHKWIAEKYDVSPGYIGRIGVESWTFLSKKDIKKPNFIMEEEKYDI